jgi:hypothetical protein
MDIILLDKKTIRVKGKKASVVINPTSSISKTEAESAIYLDNSSDLSNTKIENLRITIKGPGEYEVNGVNVSVINSDGENVAFLDTDKIKITVGKGAVVQKVIEKAENSDIAVIDVNSEFDYAELTKLEPKVLIVHGQFKDEVKKTLGKDDAESTTKYSITSDKLPSEMQLVLLG